MTATSIAPPPAATSSRVVRCTRKAKGNLGFCALHDPRGAVAEPQYGVAPLEAGDEACRALVMRRFPQ